MTAIEVSTRGMISVRGAIDLHLHSHPSIFLRIADDWEIAKAAADAGMRAIVLKSHHESTVSRAYLVSKEMPDIEVFGSITLNSYVGGINPAAVEAALRCGGKVVWLPSIDSAHHAAIYGSTGTYGWQAGGREQAKGICILRDGKLIDEILDVLRLVADYGAVLATGHLSAEEVMSVVPAAKELGVHRIVITHPFSEASQFGIELCQEMIKLGAKIEIEWTSISPMTAWRAKGVDYLKSCIQVLGVQNCILVSDAGQRHSPMPPEALRILAQCLYESGLTEHDLGAMMIDNPKLLLGLDE